jgi:hypothetical protein
MDGALLGAYLSGINTRRLRGALSPLLREAPLSKGAVSRLVGRLRDEFLAWSTRDLAEEEGLLSVFGWLVSRVCVLAKTRSRAGAGHSGCLR